MLPRGKGEWKSHNELGLLHSFGLFGILFLRNDWLSRKRIRGFGSCGLSKRFHRRLEVHMELPNWPLEPTLITDDF